MSPSPPAGPVSEFAWSQLSGGNDIAGEVALQGHGAKGWTCADQSVVLMPKTPSTTERMITLYGSAAVAVEPVGEVRARSAKVVGPDPGPYLRATRCELGNRFNFSGLPDGAYFIITRVRPRGSAAEDHDSLAVMERVTLAGGVTAHILMPTAPALH
jgi:hypothetical protein